MKDQDPRLSQFVRIVRWKTALLPYESEDDEAIKHFVWLINVPHQDLCDVEDRATDLAFKIYGDDPVPFFIGVATPEKTRLLGLGSQLPELLVAPANTASGRATVGLENGRGQGTGPSLPLNVARVFLLHPSSVGLNAASGTLSLQFPPATSRGGCPVFSRSKSVRVDATLCDAMTVREGLLHVLGGGITQLIRGTYPSPLLVDLAAWIEDDTRPPPGPKEYAIRVVLRSESGELGAVDGGATLVIPPGLQDNVILSMPVWTAGLMVPSPGRYYLDVRVNGELLRTLWVRVVEPAPAPAPAA